MIAIRRTCDCGNQLQFPLELQAGRCATCLFETCPPMRRRALLHLLVALFRDPAPTLAETIEAADIAGFVRFPDEPESREWPTDPMGTRTTAAAQPSNDATT